MFVIKDIRVHTLQREELILPNEKLIYWQVINEADLLRYLSLAVAKVDRKFGAVNKFKLIWPIQI